MSRPLASIGLPTIWLVVAGCAATAGRDFVRPSEDSLILGKTTSIEILERFGEPSREGTTLKNGQTLRTISYSYARSSAPAHATGVLPARSMSYSFREGTLVGYQFTSSFEEDHTDFDDARVGEIKEGKTTQQELFQLLGPPRGRMVYPMVDQKDGVGFVYLYVQTKRDLGMSAKIHIHNKALVVCMAPSGIVTKVDFSIGGAK